MVKPSAAKGKSGKSGKKVELGPRGAEEEQGGSGLGAVKEAEELEVELDPNVDRGLYEELSEEQRAVDRAVEVQQEKDVMALELEAMREELRAAKASAAKSARREALEVRRSGLKEKIARSRQGHERWVLTGEKGAVLEADEVRGRSPEASRSRSRGSRGSRAESSGSRRSPARVVRRRTPPRAGRRSRTRSRSPVGRLPGRASRWASPSRRARSPRRREEVQDLSTRRLAGEVAQLRRQVAAEAVRPSWAKEGNKRQYDVLQKIKGVFSLDLAKALEVTFGSGADVPSDISAVVTAELRMRAKRGELTGVRVEDMVEFY